MSAIGADRLKRAFEMSGLERVGWTFERAMQCEHTAWSIHRRAMSLRDFPAPGSVPCNWGGSKPAHMRGSKPAHMLRQHGDTVHCSCGKQFDVGDPDIEGHKV